MLFTAHGLAACVNEDKFPFAGRTCAATEGPVPPGTLVLRCFRTGVGEPDQDFQFGEEDGEQIVR
jgi:hypothetical protein